jgi:glycine oxidase
VSKRVGIVGAGLAGRMVGFELAGRGWQVDLFDRDTEEGRNSCTWTSAGMLAPSCELETAERQISALGTASLALWPALLERLGGTVYFRQRGSLVVAHPGDREELTRLERRVAAYLDDSSIMRRVTGPDIAELEPELADRFETGLYMPREAQLANRDALEAMRHALLRQGARFHWKTEATVPGPRTVRCGERDEAFDWVVDTRGMGARDDLQDLRGIRGEILIVSAPEVNLSRPVRLMHPRYAIYIVPRPDRTYLVGATAIESEDYSPISVRSTLELLTAAYTVHPGFAEARILETATNCRPAFPDNRPRITWRDGLLRLNGLYRHGFLLAPILTEFAVAVLEGSPLPAEAGDIVREES